MKTVYDEKLEDMFQAILTRTTQLRHIAEKSEKIAYQFKALLFLVRGVLAHFPGLADVAEIYNEALNDWKSYHLEMADWCTDFASDLGEMVKFIETTEDDEPTP